MPHCRCAWRATLPSRGLGRAVDGEVLSLSGHTGILNYQPKELVVTARCGTPLREIEAALAEQGQMLPFEPPHFADASDEGRSTVGATLGGTIACGLSGPARPYAGSARDLVLGTRVLTGRAEVLRFGGEVMKNVAGYDISRLMTGAFGTLGVLLDISVKVLPIPTTGRTTGADLLAGGGDRAHDGLGRQAAADQRDLFRRRAALGSIVRQPRRCLGRRRAHRGRGGR